MEQCVIVDYGFLRPQPLLSPTRQFQKGPIQTAVTSHLRKVLRPKKKEEARRMLNTGLHDLLARQDGWWGTKLGNSLCRASSSTKAHQEGTRSQRELGCCRCRSCGCRRF